jgi:hypothetical protein
MYPLPCLQGRAREGSLFDPKIKSFTPSQPPPASRGRSKVGSLRRISKTRLLLVIPYLAEICKIRCREPARSTVRPLI